MTQIERLLLQSIADEHGFTIEELRGPRKFKALSIARQAAYRALYDMRSQHPSTGAHYSLSHVARLLNRQDTSSVLYGLKAYASRSAAVRIANVTEGAVSNLTENADSDRHKE